MVTCRVLVTGFDWYRGLGFVFYHPNPSGVVASRLNGAVVNDCRVRGLILNVSYSEINVLRRVLDEYKPGIIVSMGLHPRATKPLLEMVAVNTMFSSLGDVSGYKPVFEKIDDKGPNVVSAPADIHGLYTYLKEKSFDVAPSNTLGLYLCNSVAYTIYSWAWRNKAKAVFIHVPPVGTLRLRIGMNTGVGEWGIDRLEELVREIIIYLSSPLT